MKSLLIPLVLLMVGSGAGVGAGLFLAPADADAEDTLPEGEVPAALPPCGDMPEEAGDGDAAHAAAEVEDHGDAHGDEDSHGGEAVDGREYVRLNNQFVVPVVDDGQVAALVVLSLNLEVTSGARETVFAHEPKLRDAFLRVLFDHANIGGFAGNFTSSSNMRVLRDGLRDAAIDTLGDKVADVLIIDIVRQDVPG